MPYGYCPPRFQSGFLDTIAMEILNRLLSICTHCLVKQEAEIITDHKHAQ